MIAIMVDSPNEGDVALVADFLQCPCFSIFDFFVMISSFIKLKFWLTTSHTFSGGLEVNLFGFRFVELKYEPIS